MTEHRTSLNPIQEAKRPLRRNITLRGEFLLVLLPTLTVLIVFRFVDVFSAQRLLFASLASSAFLIYLDPEHATNRVRTLLISQLMAATIGLLTSLTLGPDFAAGGIAMVATIVLMILLDVVHPPAVATSLSFAVSAEGTNVLLIFVLAVGMTAMLVLLERVMVWILARYREEILEE